MFVRIVASAILLAGCAPASPLAETEQASPGNDWAAACKDWDDWDKAGPPFRIHGNSWYVGTCGISSILVTGKEGHILIDSGTEAGAETVLANIARIGFDPADVKVLLISHEHFDHVGGMARLQEATGARLLVSSDAVRVMNSGEDQPGDPQAGMHEPFAAARVGGEVADGDEVVVGNLALHAILTPGHTPGATSWYWQSCERDDCRTIAYADSLSPISSDGYRFSDHPAYVAAFRAGLARLAAVPCDILIAPHPSAAGLRRALLRGDLATPEACPRYAAGITARLEERLAHEAADAR